MLGGERDIRRHVDAVCRPPGQHLRDERGLKKVLAEDYAFCQRWRDMGGKVYCDVMITMGHVGKYEYAGQLGKFLEMEKKEDAA